MPTDADLVRRAQAGDLACRDALAVRVAPTVIAWCHRMGGPKVDGDDAAADALCIAFQKLHTLREPERLHSWLFGITRRTLARHRRRAYLRRWAGWVSGDIPDRTHDPERASVDSQAARRFEQALQSLPEGQREVLVLVCVEERSTSEVAVMLGIPQGTVKSRLRLARERLQVDLGDWAGDAGVAALEGGTP